MGDNRQIKFSKYFNAVCRDACSVRHDSFSVLVVMFEHVMLLSRYAPAHSLLLESKEISEGSSVSSFQFAISISLC